MDAKALGAAAGVDVGTLNSWISRGHVFGVEPNAQGKRRDFDVDTATHVAIMAELASFGFGPPLAASRAREACNALKGTYVPGRQISSRPLLLIVRFGQKTDTMQYPLESEEELLRHLAGMTPSRPGVYLTINTGRIFEKMQQAEDEWQQRRKKTSGED